MSGGIDWKPDEPENRQFIACGSFFVSSAFNEMDLATIREFYAQGDGEHIPAKTGLSFGTKLLASLKEFLMTSTILCQALKL